MDKKVELVKANQKLPADLTGCQREVEMLRSELELSTAILNAMDTIALVFDPKGHIVRCNSSFEPITGYTLNEVKHQLFWKLCDQNERESVKAVFEKIQQDLMAIAHEHNWITNDGSSQSIAWDYTPLLNSDGTVKYVIGIGNDITSEAQAELATQEQVAQLEAQNRLLEARDRHRRTREEVKRQVLLEREKAATERAAELAKANEALKRSLDILATDPDLTRFIGHVLKVAAECLDSSLTEYWWHEPEPSNVVHIGLTYFQGQILTPEEQPGHPGLGGLTIKPETIHYENLHHRKRHFVREDISTDPFFDDYTAESSVNVRGWYLARGIRKELNIPLNIGETCLGGLCVYLPVEHHFTEQQIELAYALAQQVTLAIQLTRLAEEAKQAAITREQEKAARARAKEQLKDSQRRLVLLIQQMPVAIVEWNTKFEIEEWNPAAERIFGYNKEEVLGLPFSFLVPDSAQVHVSQIVGKLLSQQGGSWSINENLTKDGRTITCEWYNTPLITLNGELVGVASMALNITARKQAEEALQQANELLEQRVAERTADLANLNQALQVEVSQRQRTEQVARGQTEALVETLTVLAAEPVLDNFLGYVLQAIAQQLGEPSGGIWLYDEAYDTTILHIDCEDGQIRRGAEISRPGASIQNVLRQWDADYMQLLQEKKVLIQNVQDFPQTPAYAQSRAYNQQRGIKTLLVVCLFFGEKFLGNITLRSTKQRDYKPEELELACVLAYQASLAIQLTRLAEQAQQSAVLKERNRIAREIHDTLAQVLTGIVVQLQAAEDVHTTNPSDRQAHITTACQLAKQGLTEARRSVQALRPQALEGNDLTGALANLIEQMRTGTALQTVCRVQGTPYFLLPDVETNLLRIAQEAFTNILKHAGASEIQIELVYDPGEVRLRVLDNGQGFDPNLTPTQSYGLIGMRERTQSIGAELTITSQPGDGTEVLVVVFILSPGQRSFS